MAEYIELRFKIEETRRIVNTLDDVLGFFETLNTAVEGIYPFNTDISTAVLRKLKDKMKTGMYPDRICEEALL